MITQKHDFGKFFPYLFYLFPSLSVLQTFRFGFFRTISFGLLCSFSLSFLSAPKKKEKTEPKEKEIRRIIRACKILVRKFARHNDGKFSSKIQQSLCQSYGAFQAQSSSCGRYKTRHP